MKVLTEQTKFSSGEVKSLRKYTYYSQCKVINRGPDVQSNIDEWPILFQETGMIVYFQELTGVSLKKKKLSHQCRKKEKWLLGFM